MSENIIDATYSAQDCAFALQHGNFTHFRRELARGGHLFFPRKARPGPGGGAYRFAHVLELAIQMTVGGAYGLKVGRNVTWGLWRAMQDAVINRASPLPATVNADVFSAMGSFEADDYPKGTPFDAHGAVDYPEVFCGADIISRDASKPTFLLFEAVALGEAAPGQAASVDLIGDMSLSKAHAAIVALHTRNARGAAVIAERREAAALMPVLNLTALLAPIEERLRQRLAANEIRES